MFNHICCRIEIEFLLQIHCFSNKINDAVCSLFLKYTTFEAKLCDKIIFMSETMNGLIVFEW